jgi:hypothetical protein
MFVRNLAQVQWAGHALIRSAFTMNPDVPSSEATLRDEIDRLSNRLIRLSGRYFVCALLCVVSLYMFGLKASVYAAIPSRYAMVSKNPRALFFLFFLFFFFLKIGWLLLWIVKGIWDVVEDCNVPKTRKLLPIAVVGCMLSYVLPQTSVALFLILLALLCGSLVAGGVDTLTWKIAGLCLAGGLAQGARYLPVKSR